MRPFRHLHAQTVEEASALLKEYEGKAVLNAGGTDLIPTLKAECLPDYPEVVINIKTLPDLDYIKEEKGLVKIGALTKLSDIVRSPLLKENCKALVDAARSVATPQIRNVATLGGNLCQDVRCWYYRYPDHLGGRILCLRKGGTLCNALTGDHRYHSIFGAAPLLSYPCTSNCPAHTNIPAFLKEMRRGDLAEAARILLDFNPMPAITGRVCPIFCEPECNRTQFDEPVAIRSIERFLGDWVLERRDEFYASPKKKGGRSIAIVGSGPAGLAAAYYLRRAGHRITVFERASEPGGMLLYSIPAYRLPKEIVRRQIEALKAMGVKFKVGIPVGKELPLSSLMKDFDAVFLATGAWKERPLGIEAERYALSGLQFLNRVNEGLRELPGKRVAVIGGGNVAIDVARTLRRLGGEPVVIYRRTRAEMPAFKDEVERAAEEGVAFEFLAQPTEIVKREGDFLLKSIRIRLGPPDASGRPKPIPIKGSDFTAPFDAIIKAVGEEPDLSLLPAQFRKKVSKTDSSALWLGKNLFAGGDLVSGPSTVVKAIASAREAADLIERSLSGKSLFPSTGRSESPYASASFVEASRVRLPLLSVAERLKTMEKEEVGSLDPKEIETEASRCFHCGCIAVTPSDLGVVLTALEARVVTSKRTIDAQDFFTATATRSTLLEPEEVVKEVQIPIRRDGSRQSFLKFTLRTPVDFGIVSVASVLRIENGKCAGASIALGGVAPEPIRAKAAEEALIGHPIDEELASAAAQRAVTSAVPLPMNLYKVEITKTLIKRALLEASSP
ncbi:MAG: FAD-dependent oxidoreductase [Desulfobacterota bacterium]|nr:FAD-dependent oxidoreductase [Thermodesulfobacteriota bacterium]